MAYALLVIQLENLTRHDRVEMAQNKTVQEYVRNGKRRGRKSNLEKIAESNTTLN